MKQPYVLIRVYKGMAEIVYCSGGVRAEILDMDVLEERNRKDVVLSKRMWAHLKKEFPGEYERLKGTAR